jgi:hypothetical protein
MTSASSLAANDDLCKRLCGAYQMRTSAVSFLPSRSRRNGMSARQQSVMWKTLNFEQCTVSL